MSHLPILPFIVPFVTAGLLLLLNGLGIAAKRRVSAIAVAVLVIVSFQLLASVHDERIHVYRLGDWPAPFGIVLVADRLAALMVVLTALLAAAVVASSIGGTDAEGRHFHVFLQLQLAGLNGAFLTGDIFNLFVFFEILLLASYALLMHGGGLVRSRAGLGYVIMNLAGSALFLIALGLTYGSIGTLNMADLVQVLPNVAPADQPPVRVALALLVAVFVFKAALLPIGFWLPHVYTAAPVPVAVLFVIMTKVGIYALLRLSTIGLSTAPFTSDLLAPWLAWLSVATIGFGVVGALAASRMSAVIASIIVISSGTLLLGVAAGTVSAHAAMLYYLINTTVVAAGLFLLADHVSRQRGTVGDAFEKGPRLTSVALVGGAYLVLSLAASGMPPLSGFLAKLMVMQSLGSTNTMFAAWFALVVSGFVVALVLARAASTYFWEPAKSAAAETSRKDVAGHAPSEPGRAAGLAGLLALTIVVTVAAAPISSFARATAEQIAAPEKYVTANFGSAPPVKRERRP